MADWDEGEVFYADQGLAATPDDTPNDIELGYLPAPATTRKAFRLFLSTFEDSKGGLVYRAKVESRNTRALHVHLEHLLRFDPVLAEAVKRRPADYLTVLERAANDLQRSHESSSTGGGEEEKPGNSIQVLLMSSENPKKIRDLTSQYISKLVVIPGIVTAAGKTKAKAQKLSIQCKSCSAMTSIDVKPGLTGVSLPRKCMAPQQEGAQDCGLDPYVIVPERSIYIDQQTLKLQEAPEDVPTGELPRTILLTVDRTLVQQIVPGARVTVVGISSVFSSGNSDRDSKGKDRAVALKQPYIRVVGMEEMKDGSATIVSGRDNETFTKAEELAFMDFARDKNVYQSIVERIAPSIFGHDEIKRAVACLLFGGTRKRVNNGVRLRGDINVLLLGDPSTAKSQFLKFVEKTAPVAVYTSGKGSSAAGLTASVVRDGGTGEFVLEGGAMVLADGGVACIDEFDKMRVEDRVAIHEAMEQQTISIAKAGITTVLNSRTSVLAAANPPSGRYDELKNASENMDLATTILSRFDLLFIVKDEKNMQRDMQIARHILNSHARGAVEQSNANGDSNANGILDPNSPEFLRRYVDFCRRRCHPRLSENAAKRLRDYYVEIRQRARQRMVDALHSGAHGGPPIPITVRQLEAIVRISESLARMELQPYAKEEHVEEAIRLFRTSTLDAAEAGVQTSMAPTGEQRAEIQAIEVQVKKRVPIGSFTSEKGLLRDLERIGVSEAMARKALVVMHQRNEIDYRRERRTIVRKQ